MSIKKDCIMMDVDGVLLDLVPAVKAYVFNEYGVYITPNMITSWDWDYALGIPLMCNKFWDHVWNSALPTYDKAVEFIDILKALDYRVIAVSNRTTPSAKENAAKQFPMFNFDYWVLCDSYKDKLRYAHEIEAHWALEDNPKTAALLGRGKPDLHSFLLTRPWNKESLPLLKSYTRIGTYDKFVKALLTVKGWGL